MIVENSFTSSTNITQHSTKFNELALVVTSTTYTYYISLHTSVKGSLNQYKTRHHVSNSPKSCAVNSIPYSSLSQQYVSLRCHPTADPITPFLHPSSLVQALHMRLQLVADSQRLAPSPLSAPLLCRLRYVNVDRIAIALGATNEIFFGRVCFVFCVFRWDL